MFYKQPLDELLPSVCEGPHLAGSYQFAAVLRCFYLNLRVSKVNYEEMAVARGAHKKVCDVRDSAIWMQFPALWGFVGPQLAGDAAA